MISNDQTGFLPNRYIGENIRLLQDIIEHVENKNMPGMIFFLDFEKAYDKLEWNFINKCFDLFGFGHDLKKWIKLFYTKICSCIINKGHISKYFTLSRSLRQGCPLSGYIFILCAELFAIAVRKNDNIKGIAIDENNSVKLAQYADDTDLILDGSKDSLYHSIQLLNNFSDVSGLVVNYSKSYILKIGSIKNDDTIFFPEMKVVWSKGPIKFLGINISLDKKEMIDLNYEVQLKKISNILNFWSQRGITPIGKVTVIKSLAISQLTYLLSVLPNPPHNYF